MRIVVDFARCEGNGQCVTDAPDVFDLDAEDNLIVHDYEPPPEQWAQVEAAVRSCPKRALAIAPDGPEVSR
ncbi:MAG: ferredoxin [Acidimicrobiales bacterium]|jgi:ferredoxin